MKKFGVKHILGMVFECCAIVFLVLCMATDINDDLFLPLALGCAVVGSSLAFVIQLEARKKAKESQDKNRNDTGR